MTIKFYKNALALLLALGSVAAIAHAASCPILTDGDPLTIMKDDWKIEEGRDKTPALNATLEALSWVREEKKIYCTYKIISGPHKNKVYGIVSVNNYTPVDMDTKWEEGGIEIGYHYPCKTAKRSCRCANWKTDCTFS